ncbi:MAG: isoaspartyl peptidase/L-asparaginase [Bacteroidetes bacterium]|nr:isoaspartyl peptidase/L-asparaginase [Bacteroidota bacterium]
MIALSTWKHGVEPNRIIYDTLTRGGSALDGVEAGARHCEADITCMSVGKGGLPDELGIVTLDASIMDHDGSCGSVAFVRSYLHPVSIARRVMEKTSHVMLAGAGAERFAEEEEMERDELLTAAAKTLYETWRRAPAGLSVRLRRSQESENEYVFEYEENGVRKELDRAKLGANESHDTIGLIARDASGRLAGACTTSGLAFKKHGRVGDSPIIGAGLFVDGEVAAAVATGNGELVMRACSSFHIVEQIRQGVEPIQAMNVALDRIRRDKHLTDDMQIGLLTIRADGAWAAGSLREGFQFVVASTDTPNTLYQCIGTSYQPAA